MWKDGLFQPVGQGWAIRVIQRADVLLTILFPHYLLPWQSLDQDLYKHFIDTYLDQLEIAVQWNSGAGHHMAVFKVVQNYQDAVGLHECFIMSKWLSVMSRETGISAIFLL